MKMNSSIVILKINGLDGIEKYFYRGKVFPLKRFCILDDITFPRSRLKISWSNSIFKLRMSGRLCSMQICDEVPSGPHNIQYGFFIQ